MHIKYRAGKENACIKAIGSKTRLYVVWKGEGIMNQENLTPFTSESGREAGKKGGKASGEAKKQRKLIKEYVDTLLANNPDDAETNDAGMIAFQMVNQAKKGNLKAIRLLLQLLGELDKEKVRIDINANPEETELYKKGFDDAMRYMYARLPDDILRKWIEEDEVPIVNHNPEVLAEIVGLTYSR